MHFFAQADLEEQISSLALRTVGVSALALIVLTLIAVIVMRQSATVQKYLKLPLFIGMAGVMVLSTLLLAGSTVYLNVKSESGGPVHWHSGIEFWTCGTEVNLRDPSGLLSNKVGTATYHEHNDKYIHLEGVVVKKSYDASLEKFMEVTGGYITDRSIGIPLSEDSEAWPIHEDLYDGDNTSGSYSADTAAITEGRVASSADGPVLELQNGQSCPGSQEPASLQVFVYTFNKESNTYSQEKLADPGSYVMRDESALGPPSDCVIVEFGPEKAATDKLCEQYGVKDSQRCTEFGVKAYDAGLCNIVEVNKPQAAEDVIESDPAVEPSANACLYDPNNPVACEDTPQTETPPPSPCTENCDEPVSSDVEATE